MNDNSHSPNQSLYEVKNEAEFVSTTANLVNELREQLQNLTDQLSGKANEATELNSCLIKQTNLNENLSNLLRASEEKNKQLEASYSSRIETLQNENGIFIE